jgi:hypothetical protein
MAVSHGDGAVAFSVAVITPMLEFEEEEPVVASAAVELEEESPDTWTAVVVDERPPVELLWPMNAYRVDSASRTSSRTAIRETCDRRITYTLALLDGTNLFYPFLSV